MRRILSVVLSAVVFTAFVLSGCTAEYKTTASVSKPTEAVSAEKAGALSSIKLKNCYNLLETDAQRRCYRAILNNSTAFTQSTESGLYLMKRLGVSKYGLTKAEVEAAVDAFFGDNPRIFWIDTDYSYTITNGVVYEIQLYSVMSEAQYLSCKKRLNNRVASFINSVKENKSDFELELEAHNYIIKNCEYEDNPSKSDSEPYTCYGALVSGRAVCQGYTKAFQLLLSEVGINSVNVSGFGENVEHIWNAVRLDGDWYYTDVTWDDSDKRLSYDYFNITTKQLKKTHKINPTYKQAAGRDTGGLSLNFYVPRCNSTQYNYYYRFASHLEDMNNNTLAEDLALAADRGEEYFYIYVDPQVMDYTLVYDQLFSDAVYGFAEYILQANKMTEVNKLSTTVSIYKNKNVNTIIVKLNYE